MKACSVCDVVKPAQDFQVRKLSIDGRTAACRACLKERDANRYVKEREKRKSWARGYYKTPKGKQIVDRLKRRWERKNQTKKAAHTITSNAIRDGRLLKEPCEKCGTKINVQAHHDDYFKPLEVRWLCITHHREHHKNNPIYLLTSRPA